MDKPSDYQDGSMLPPEVADMISLLRELRTVRVGDTPDEQGTWLNGCINGIDGVVLEKITDPALRTEIDEVLRYFRSIVESRGMLKSEDIDKMNGLIDKVFHYYNQKFSN